MPCAPAPGCIPGVKRTSVRVVESQCLRALAARCLYRPNRPSARNLAGAASLAINGAPADVEDTATPGSIEAPERACAGVAAPSPIQT